MNTPVKFELAKLLKEKNIKIDTEEVIFYRDEVNNIEEHQIKNRDVLYNYTGFNNYTFDENEYQTYIIAEVVMWLYKKHGIWISVIDVSPSHILWEYQISRKEVGLIYSSGQYPVKHNYSPTEAYEAAIEYTLKNLIP